MMIGGISTKEASLIIILTTTTTTTTNALVQLVKISKKMIEPIVNNKHGEMFLLADTYSRVSTSLVCFSSIVCNLLSVLALLKLRAKMSIYEYMLCKCAAHLLYSFIAMLFVLIVNAAPSFDHHRPHSEQSLICELFKAYAYGFVGKAVLMFSTLVEICICVQRLVLVAHIVHTFECCRRQPRLLMLVLGALSLVLYLPAVLFVEIKQNVHVVDGGGGGDNLTIQTISYYYTDDNELIVNNRLAMLMVGIEMGLNGWLMALVIFVLSMLIYFAARERANTKRRMKRLHYCMSGDTRFHSTYMTANYSITNGNLRFKENIYIWVYIA